MNNEWLSSAADLLFTISYSLLYAVFFNTNTLSGYFKGSSRDIHLFKQKNIMQHIIDRFISYVIIDTESDAKSETTPSTHKQLVLAKLLVKELKAIVRYEVVYVKLDKPLVSWI